MSKATIQDAPAKCTVDDPNISVPTSNESPRDHVCCKRLLSRICIFQQHASRCVYHIDCRNFSLLPRCRLYTSETCLA